MGYVLLCVASFIICISVANKLNLSKGWAIFLGLCLSPASGIGYIYMLLTEDREPWRVSIVAITLSLFIGFVFLLFTGYFNH
jgi:hypothetical protein